MRWKYYIKLVFDLFLFGQLEYVYVSICPVHETLFSGWYSQRRAEMVALAFSNFAQSLDLVQYPSFCLFLNVTVKKEDRVGRPVRIEHRICLFVMEEYPQDRWTGLGGGEVEEEEDIKGGGRKLRRRTARKRIQWNLFNFPMNK